MRHSIHTLRMILLVGLISMGVALDVAQAQFSGNSRTTRQPPKNNFGGIKLNTGPQQFNRRPPTSGGGKVLGRIEIPSSQPFNNSFNSPGNSLFRPQPIRPRDHGYEYEGPQRRHQPQHYPQSQQYRQPQRTNSNDYRYPPRAVSPPPRATPAPAKVKANAKPPERIVSTRSNSAPAFALLEPIDAESYAIAGEMVEEQARKSVDRLEEQLGDVANEPAVANKLAELREKIAAGVRVTDQDIAHLESLVKLVDQSKFPPGFDPNGLTASLDDVINMSEANELLQRQTYPNGGLTAGLPSGSVLMMPALPDEEMLLLPGGGVMMGAGGEGELGIVAEDAGEMLGISVGAGEPEPDSEANVAKRVKSGVYLMHPEDAAAEISYVVSGNSYTIKPGYTQVLPEGQTWVIRFDQGEGKGEAKYTLRDGAYAFGESDGSWDLFKQSFSVTVDNADNENPFYVNIDNAQEEIGAQAKRTFTSKYPILVRFDRGQGGDPAQKRITRKNADLVVAVNRVDGLWDLFPAKNYQGVARESSAKKSKIHQALLREKLRLSLGRD